jgi:hypothetical protein
VPASTRSASICLPRSEALVRCPAYPRDPICPLLGPKLPIRDVRSSVASLIGRLGSSTFRLFITAVSMSPTGSCFSSESAPRPFHHGSRGRGGTIYRSALPSEWRWVQATERTHLIHRPAGDIIPPLGGARVFSYRICLYVALMPLLFLSGSSGTRCHQPICGA